MGSVRIRPAADIRELTTAAFAMHRRRVLRLLPGAEVEHVGSTAVPGALTKGDVDLLVRVGAADFATAVEVLGHHYVVHQPHNWTASLASFKDPTAREPPVGVQLVIAGSAEDAFFGPFRDALIKEPALLAEYNRLKRSLDGADYASYTTAKGEFVERALRAINDPRA
jgi:GrpB-like predicted nucleotidyltransferase (UPF0157 family)